MIKIYGSAMSSAKRCIWFLEELNLQYEIIRLNMQTQEHKGEEYRALNPNGKVPTLIDDGFVIWESSAINVYLAEKHAPEWLGIGAEEHGLIAQWTFWNHTEIGDEMEPLILQKWMQTPENDITREAPAKINACLAILEKSLEGRQYLVADRFTLADLNLAATVELVPWVGIDLAVYENISKWLANVQTRPGYVRMKATVQPAA